MKTLLPLLLLTLMANAQNQYLTPYEKGNGNQTATYDETIAWFRNLDADFDSVLMREMGLTDCGEPLHIVIFNPDNIFDFDMLTQHKAVLLLNNGIHPGEPDGIDATMLLFRDMATGKIDVPKNVVVVNIPIYNIGGALNRGSFSRANQNGPESYGFRGNARNYDLNRDFLKSDSRNARSFAEIFHSVHPDILIDNHVSNGADYQYTFTYIATQHQKLGGSLGKFWNDEMIPQLLKAMKQKKIESVPYVNIHDEKPDNGFAAFMDSPRYSTGYASMFDVPGIMPETHMLKKYADRVNVTYEFMVETLSYMDKHHLKIKKLRKQNIENHLPGMKYVLQWKLDQTQSTPFSFLGFEGDYKPSDISGKPRLYFDRTQPFKKQIPYFTHFMPSIEVTIPEAYIIPKSWWNVIELMKINKIEMTTLEKDTEYDVESYRIGSYDTSPYSYEGHYPHGNVALETTTIKKKFHKGDFVVSTRQKGVKYLLETLEPKAVDSYLNWNFFDPILQQKEYYSPYVFEDLAKQLLDQNAALRTEFEKKKAHDETFAESGREQLDWIYQNSDYYEKSHLQYPVYRKMN